MEKDVECYLCKRKVDKEHAIYRMDKGEPKHICQVCRFKIRI